MIQILALLDCFNVSIRIRMISHIVVFVAADYIILNDKYCDWSDDNPGQFFNNEIDVKAYCDVNPSCIGYYGKDRDWMSCPPDSKQTVLSGRRYSLYQKGKLIAIKAATLC